MHKSATVLYYNSSFSNRDLWQNSFEIAGNYPKLLFFISWQVVTLFDKQTLKLVQRATDMDLIYTKEVSPPRDTLTRTITIMVQAMLRVVQNHPCV